MAERQEDRRSKLSVMVFEHQKGAYSKAAIDIRSFMECQIGLIEREHYEVIVLKKGPQTLFSDLSDGVGLRIPVDNKCGLVPSGVLIGYQLVLDYLKKNKRYIKRQL